MNLAIYMMYFQSYAVMIFITITYSSDIVVLRLIKLDILFKVIYLSVYR